MTSLRRLAARCVDRRFPILYGHAGESQAFRRRFRAAIALLFAYRALATVAAIAGFVSIAGDRSSQPIALVALASLYAAGAVVGCWWIADVDLRLRGRTFHFGAGSQWWIDRPIFYEADLAIAVAANLLAARLLDEGQAYRPNTDLLAIAMITTAVLWTGRRGGRRGLSVLALAFALELVKAPTNGVPWTDISWPTVATRMLWASSGVIVGLGVVRILIDYAERIERLRIGEEELSRLSRTHNDFKAALTRIADVLLTKSGSGAITEARTIAFDALDPIVNLFDPVNSLASLAKNAAQRGRAANPAMDFTVVDATEGLQVRGEPANLAHALEALVVNAARHSRGTRTTIRCDQVDGYIEVTICDNGVGMDVDATGGGIALVRELVASYGGQAYRGRVDVGTLWVLRLPPSTVGVESQ